MTTGDPPDPATAERDRGDPGCAATPPVPLRANREFTLLWCGQAVSGLGSAATLLAYPLLILSVSGSAVQAGAVGTAIALVRTVFRLPGGALADRWNRRTMMLACDAGRIALLGLLAALVLGQHATVSVVLVIALLSTVLDVLFEPAALAAVSRLVPAEQLPQAFGRNEARSSTAALAGPPLGGALFGLARFAPFVFDALTYLVSLLALTCIRKPLQGTREAQSSQSLFAGIGQGLRVVRRSRLLRALVLIFVLVDFAFPAAMFTVIVVLRQTGQSAGTIGIAQGAIGAGGVLGALAAPWMQRQASFRSLVNLTVAVLCSSLALTAVLSGSLAMVLPLTVALFMAPALNAAIFAKLASTTPEHLQGRVISVILASTGVSVAAAPLAAGLLITHLGGWAALTACAAATSAALTVTTTSRGLKEA